MLGAIIGDVVGSIYEKANIKTKNFELFSEMGRFTDDSVMTIAVATALRKWNRENGIEAFKEILIDSAHIYGEAYIDCGFGRNFGRWILKKDRKPYGSYGNGSAMRVSSIAWFAKSLEETKLLARVSAEITHNHYEGIKGAEATAVAIYLAKTAHSIPEIKKYICDNYYNINFTLDEIRPWYKFDISCQGSVPQALEAFFESTSFEDAIRNAVSIGGDCDTITAITGSIAEAYYGIDIALQEKALTYLDDLLIRSIKLYQEYLKL